MNVDARHAVGGRAQPLVNTAGNETGVMRQCAGQGHDSHGLGGIDNQVLLMMGTIVSDNGQINALPRGPMDGW